MGFSLFHWQQTFVAANLGKIPVVNNGDLDSFCLLSKINLLESKVSGLANAIKDDILPRLNTNNCGHSTTSSLSSSEPPCPTTALSGSTSWASIASSPVNCTM